MDTSNPQPLVSVVMPAYNAERYIGEAISSVLSQTYKNWELLILDDCSSDRTAEIAEHFVSCDTRIHLLRNPQNMGVAKTRNRGLTLAQGEWVALLDSDDVWRSDKVEKQLALAERSRAELVYTSYELFSSTESKIVDYYIPEKTDYSHMLKENVIGCSTVMLRRSIYERFRFREDVYHEDYALWLEILRHGHIAVGCTEILTNWRISEKSRSFDKRSAAKNRWLIYRKIENLSLLRSGCAFAAYAVHGMAKHRRVR